MRYIRGRAPAPGNLPSAVHNLKTLSQDTCRAKTRHPTKTGACGDILVRAKPPMGLELRQEPHTRTRTHVKAYTGSHHTHTSPDPLRMQTTLNRRRMNGAKDKESMRVEEIQGLQAELKVCSAKFVLFRRALAHQRLIQSASPTTMGTFCV